MGTFPDNAIDVTKQLAQALPDFLSDWTRARLFLVLEQPASMNSSRGGLAAGVLRRIREHIDRELAGSIQLHDLAALAGLSDCHFARAFKQSVGVPPHRYVINRRVEKAIELIRTTDRPLSRIALDVGFCDQSHLGRQIARATGHSPRELRRESSAPLGRVAVPGVVA